VGWSIYWVNQYAVRKSLAPRRKELETLLRSLNEPGERSSDESALRAKAIPRQLDPHLFLQIDATDHEQDNHRP
jgi:hypothetical protein